MERETVNALLRKTERADDQIAYLKGQEEANLKLIEMLRGENTKLVEKLEFTKFNVRKTLEEWAIDKNSREDLLTKTIMYYKGRMKVFEEEMDEMNHLFHEEILVKDNII